MIIHSANDAASVFADGKVKPGIYRIQNIAGHTYLDIRDEKQELCCRPITVLEGKGLVSPRLQLSPIPLADHL